MKFSNVFATKLATFFLVTLLSTLTAPLSVFSQQSTILDSVALSNKSKSSKSNVILDLLQDDIKVSIIDYSQNRLLLKIWKGSEVLGTAEVQNEKDNQRTTFTTSSGLFFSLITTKTPKNLRNNLRIPNSQVIDSEGYNYTMSLRTLNDSVTLDILQFKGEAEISLRKQKKVQRILLEIDQDNEISRLMKATSKFTAENDFANFLEYEGDTAYQCMKASGGCFISAAAWVGSVATLSGFCPGTFGLTCAGALILHGVLGGYAAMDCADAIGTCSNDPRPLLVQ